jgi:hypothetical protein
MIEKIPFPRFDAELNTDVCDDYNNAELTLTMRIGFRRIDPSAGAAQGMYHDYGSAASPQRKIIRWTPDAWAAWKRRFVLSAQTYWHGRFWLINDSFSFEYSNKAGVAMYPNAWCRFKLLGVDAPAANLHHTIDVVRLHASENWFGSHATLYDSKDTALVQKGVLSTNKPVMQRAHVHEIGHLLGLNRVDVGKAHCPAAGNTNLPACYGVADSDMQSVMGAGMQLRVEHAYPWRECLRQLSAQAALRASGAPVNMMQLLAPVTMSSTVWPAVTVRQHPRTLAEVVAKKAVLTRRVHPK